MRTFKTINIRYRSRKMRINNYRGIVNDQPMDTVVVDPTQDQNQFHVNENRPNFMDRILQFMNSHNVVPMTNIPTYDKG